MLTTRDLDEVRRILDTDDDTDQDMYQLMERGALPTRLPALMVAATGGLIAAGLALTFVAGPLFAYTDRAAADLVDPTVYISSVLPAGAR